MDEPGFRACDEYVRGGDSVMTKGAGGIITCARTKAVQVIGMKGVSCDKLETCRLEVVGASTEAPLSEIWEGTSSGLGKNRELWV